MSSEYLRQRTLNNIILKFFFGGVFTFTEMRTVWLFFHSILVPKSPSDYTPYWMSAQRHNIVHKSTERWLLVTLAVSIPLEVMVL